jgi:hypothetical protein
MVTRRVAEQVAVLNARTGDLTARKTRRTQKLRRSPSCWQQAAARASWRAQRKGQAMTTEMLTRRT